MIHSDSRIQSFFSVSSPIFFLEKNGEVLENLEFDNSRNKSCINVCVCDVNPSQHNKCLYISLHKCNSGSCCFHTHTCCNQSVFCNVDNAKYCLCIMYCNKYFRINLDISNPCYVYICCCYYKNKCTSEVYYK